MATVLDYSYSRYRGSQLAAWGFSGVVRYACGGRPAVNITKGEADDLRANGLGIAITTEYESNWLLLDPALVKSRVQQAVDITRASGLPDGVIYLACDFDATLGGPPVSASALGNMRALLNGLEAAATVLGGNTGLYGGAYVIDYVAQHSLIGHYWQTIGWSGGWLHPKAALYQDRVNRTLGNGSVDLNTVIGNWAPRGSVTPHYEPPRVSVNVRAIQQAVHATADGVWGPETDRNCELVRLAPNCNIGALQRYSLGFTGAAIDGIVGNQTVLATLAAVQGIQRGLGVAADGKWGPQTQAAYVAVSPFH